MSLRDDLLSTRNASDVPPQPAPPVPEWPAVDGQLYFRTLAEADLHVKPAKDDEPVDEAVFRATIVSRVLADSNGNRILRDDDAPALAAKETAVIERLYHQAREYNGLTEENRKAVRKNSAGTGTSGSPTSSPGPSATPGA
ncbi:MAG: hypothetical protein ABSA30_00020 [Candidatus Aminicenantales bacterium]|jgi:hypothetical protein